MTVAISIRVEGVDKVLKDLDPRKVDRARREIVRVAHLEIRNRMAAYPPEGPWNWPAGPGSRWYQRHFGPRWMRKDGSIGGRNTSQRLQQSWRARWYGSWAEVYTSVTYAPYVVGHESQARFHKAHGWHTDKQVAERYERERLPVIAERILDREFGG